MGLKLPAWPEQYEKDIASSCVGGDALQIFPSVLVYYLLDCAGIP